MCECFVCSQAHGCKCVCVCSQVHAFFQHGEYGLASQFSFKTGHSSKEAASHLAISVGVRSMTPSVGLKLANT